MSRNSSRLYIDGTGLDTGFTEQLIGVGLLLHNTRSLLSEKLISKSIFIDRSPNSVSLCGLSKHYSWLLCIASRPCSQYFS